MWHYTDAAGLLSIVRHHVLWATAAGFLNDLQEIELGLQRLLTAVEHRAQDKNSLADILGQALKRTGQMGRGPSFGTFFILSAASHWDLLAMWRCYGGVAESYAIGLDPTQPLPVLADPGTGFQSSSEGWLRPRPGPLWPTRSRSRSRPRWRIGPWTSCPP